MKKGFSAYLEERENTDYDFGVILEGRTLEDIGKEYGVTKQAIGNVLRRAMDKIYYGLQSASPESTPGELFYMLCHIIGAQNSRDIYMSLGVKIREAIRADAQEKGIGV